MKKIFLLSFVLLNALCIFAQRFAPVAPPTITSEMPSWAKHFYEKKNVFELNVQTIDTAYDNYYKTHKFEKNNWTKYYKRWRRGVDSYIKSDGSIVRPTDAEIEALHADYQANMKKSTGERSSTWQLVGPVKTHWLKNDNVAQPECPWQANIYAFDISVSNPSILYAATETGAMYKTTDKGLNWTQTGADFFLETMGAVAINPISPDTVYVGNDKIYMTTNGGTSWQTSYNVGGLEINDIKVNPTNTGSVLAGGKSGLYRRNASTGVWSQVFSNKTYDIAYKPSSGSIVYALRNNGTTCEFMKSTDGGANFTVRSTGWVTGLTDEGGRMSVTTIDANKVYVVLLTGSGPRVLRSDDAGETWTITASGNGTVLAMSNGQGYYDLSIVASQTVNNQVIVATTTAYKSIDGGVNYTTTGGYSGSFEVHPDIQEMQAVGGDTWIVTDGGLTYSTDFFTSNGTTRMKGVNASDFWGFDQGWNENSVCGGRYHNGNSAWYEGYPVGQFFRMGGGEAPTGYINPSNARMCYFSDLGGKGKLLPTTFGGLVTTVTTNLMPNETYFTMQTGEIEWDPRNYNVYYVGSGASVMKTVDGGLNSSTLFTSPDAGAVIEHVRVSRANPDVIYATQRSNTLYDGKIWKTTNGGGIWTACALTPTSSGGDRRVSTITVSATNSSTLWVVNRNGDDGEKIYKSTNGGMSWNSLNTSTLNGAKIGDIANIIGTDYVVIVCDNARIYYGNGSGWTVYNTGLPLNTNAFRVKPFYRDNKLRIASNQGIYEADIPVTVPSSPQIMVDKFTTPCSRDTFYFDSYSVAAAGATYNWTFPSATYVSSTTVRNPKVVYGAAGSYSATLSVNGVSQTLTNLVSINGTACDIDTTIGKSLDLTAAGNLINIPKIPSFAGATSFSVSAWVKPMANQQSFTEIVSSHGSNVGFAFGFAFMGYTANTNLTFYWTGVPYQLTTTHTLPINEWSHIALTITPTLATIYVNGKPWTRAGSYSGFDFSNVPFDVAYGDLGQGGNFNGHIEELKFYNYALSQTEVREKIHLLRSGVETGLITHYQFNETSGNIVYDKVGTAHGTIAGTFARPTSTVPAATGKSALLTVNSAGVKNFGNTGVSLTFPTGTYPNGEVGAYRLFANPDQLPSTTAIPNNAYWIVRNFGTNATFTALTGASFTAENINPTFVGNPQSVSLFKRNSNAEGATWGTQIGTASTVTANKVTFGAVGITSFSQFAMAQNATPLPVETLGFNAAADKNTAVLTWAVVNQSTLKNFILERSDDGILFRNIADISPTKSPVYRYLDKNLKNSSYYYRLKSVETDGWDKKSAIVQVTINDDHSIVIYPNPSNDFLNIKLNNVENNGYEILNSLGQSILQNATIPEQIDIKHLETGIYYLKINNEMIKVLKK